MLYPETTVCNELRWEYGYSKKRALAIIAKYREAGQYEQLCRLIEHRKVKGASVCFNRIKA